MKQRQLRRLSVSAILIALVFSITLSATVIAATYQPYPAMPAGQSTGSITGRVTNTNGTGISGANVTIVNASNQSILYTYCKTDSDGYYGISGVNSTGGGNAYRVYANATGYNDSYSIPVCVEPANTCNVHLLILTGNGTTSKPTPSPTPTPGNVSGYVTLAGYGGAISDATVTLVDALDAFTVYRTAHTDYYGRYRFDGVEIIGSPGYRLHVEKDGCVEAYSSPFIVKQNTSVTVNMTLSKTPVATAVNSTSHTTPAGGTVTPAPTEAPSASPVPHVNAGLPGVPGFEALAALAGVGIAYAVARKR